MLETGSVDVECVIPADARPALASGSRGKAGEGVADFPVPPLASAAPRGYTKLLRTLKERIQSARLRASRTVNRELLLLYFEIGFHLDRKLADEKWGTSIIDRASVDLRRAFPEMDGLSPRNLRRMRAFYSTYRPIPKRAAIWPRSVAKLGTPTWPPAAESLPWGHHVTLVEKVKDRSLREFYIAAASEHGWSRDTLAMQIDAQFHARQGKAMTNFRETLPHPQSELAQELTRDPYQFGFLSLARPCAERDIERQLVEHVREMLLELGKGFAFVGSQVHLRVHDNDYYLDLLFYHVKLHCFVVIELKEGHFKPEHAGKMNFYLSAVDDLLRSPEDKPTIGLLLCRSKRHFEVEYALRGIDKPMGVAEWQSGLAKNLPIALTSSLPTVEEIEAELRRESLALGGQGRLLPERNEGSDLDDAVCSVLPMLRRSCARLTRARKHWH